MNSPPLTFDDVMRLFQETDRMTKDFRSDLQEIDSMAKQFRLDLQEINRTTQALQASQLETDRLFKEMRADREDTERRFKETDRLFKETNKKIGDLGNRLGEFVQEMVRPAVVRLFRERNIEVHQVMRNIEAFNDDIAVEIDLLVINRQQAIAVECKSRLTVDDVNDHVARLDKFKRLFPQYQNLQLMGAVAGMVVSDEAARYAYRQGLFVLAQSGDAVLIHNDARFSPKLW